MTLILKHISHAYGNTSVLNSVNLLVKPAELVCLVGASGSGKSTLLRLIAGLEKVQRGSIWLGDRLLADAQQHIPAQQRTIGLVFQHPSLFPHLNVEQNIRFGIRHLSKDTQHAKAKELLALIGLEHKASAYPHQLSGGQHQRVALARSLAPEPEAMLLDEPFANLDHSLRREIREEVISLLKQAHIPIIMVTHDPEEALIMADTMVLLGTHGSVHQSGTPDSIHNHPKDVEAARFFGHVNLFAGKIEGEWIRSKLGNLPRAFYAPSLPNHADVVVATRPEGIRIAAEGEAAVQVCVERIGHTGAGWLVTAHTPEGEKLQFHHIYGTRPQKGETLFVTYEQPHLFVFAI